MNIVEEPRYNPNSSQPNGQQGGFQQQFQVYSPYKYNSQMNSYSPVGTQAMAMPQQQPLAIPTEPFRNRAPVCCNCCNCSHDSCAQCWAIFNLIQVYICYFLIAIRHLFWEWSNSLVQNPKLRKENDSSECWEMYRVAGSFPTNVTFSVEILLLLLYTIGSIFFAAAVFHKTLGPQKRSIFLLIYIILLASLPLAYFIPLVIRYCLCVKAGTGNLIMVGVWFIVIVSTTICGANVAWVLRKWVTGSGNVKTFSPMPQTQMQIEGSKSTIASTTDN